MHQDTRRAQIGSESPLVNFGIGNKIALDRSHLGASASRVQFSMPGDLQTIRAVGTTEIGSKRLVRYYFVECDGFIEIDLRLGVLRSCRLFAQDMEEFPIDERQWKRWRARGEGRLGAPTILHGDYEYKRLWNSSGGWVNPVLMVESLVTDDSAEPLRIEKLGMMYYRTDPPPLGSSGCEFREFMTILADDVVIETYLGIDYDVSRIEMY